MQGALDHVALEDAVGQIGGGMGATCLGGIEGAVDIVDGDGLAADLKALDASGRKIGGGADGKGVFGHDVTDVTWLGGLGWVDLADRGRLMCFNGLAEKFNRARG